MSSVTENNRTSWGWAVPSTAQTGIGLYLNLSQRDYRKCHQSQKMTEFFPPYIRVEFSCSLFIRIVLQYDATRWFCAKFFESLPNISGMFRIKMFPKIFESVMNLSGMLWNTILQDFLLICQESTKNVFSIRFFQNILNLSVGVTCIQIIWRKENL